MPLIKSEELQPEEDLRVLFVGDSGSGKSTASCSFASPDRKMLMIDIDRRGQSVAGIPGLDIFQPNPRDGWMEIDPHLEKIIDLVKVGKYPYKTTSLASVTSVTEVFTRDSLKFIKSGIDLKAMVAKGEQIDPDENFSGAMKIGSLTIPGMRNYLYRSEVMKQLYYNVLLMLPGNVIAEAHLTAKYKTVELPGGRTAEVQDGEKILGPDKFAEALPGYFNHIWHFTTKKVSETRREYWCTFHGGDLARTSTGNPNHPNKMKKLVEKKKINWTDKNFYEEVMKIIDG